MTVDELMKVTDTIIEGLRTDGAHHKQWYLEQVLAVLYGQEWVEQHRGLYGWDEGIAE